MATDTLQQTTTDQLGIRRRQIQGQVHCRSHRRPQTRQRGVPRGSGSQTDRAPGWQTGRGHRPRQPCLSKAPLILLCCPLHPVLPAPSLAHPLIPPHFPLSPHSSTHWPSSRTHGVLGGNKANFQGPSLRPQESSDWGLTLHPATRPPASCASLPTMRVPRESEASPSPFSGASLVIEVLGLSSGPHFLILCGR